MAFHSWDLRTAVVHSQTLFSPLEAGGRNFRVEDTLQSVWGAEQQTSLEVAGWLTKLI